MSRFLGIVRWVFLWLAVALVMPAMAQSGTPDLAKSLKPLIEQAEKSGATVVVVSPKSAQETTAAAVASDPMAMLNRIGFRLRTVAGGIGEFPARVAKALNVAGGGNGLGWLFYAVALGIVAAFVGRMAAKPVAWWSLRSFGHMLNEFPKDRTEKIGRSLFFGFQFMLMIAIMVVVACVIVVLGAGGSEAVRTTGLMIVVTYAAMRTVRAVLWNVLAFRVPQYRLLQMDDDSANRLYFAAYSVSVISLALLGAAAWLKYLGLEANAHKLMLLVTLVVSAVMLSGVAIAFRGPVGQAFLGSGPALIIPLWRRILARTWYIIAIAYFAVAVLVSAARHLLDQPNAAGLLMAPTFILIGGAIVYGLLLIFIDRLVGGDEPVVQAVSSAVTTDAAAAEGEQEILPDGVTIRSFKPLFERAALALVTIGGLIILFDRWGGSDAIGDNPLVRFINVVVVLFLAYFAYQAVRIWIDGKLAEEGYFDVSDPSATDDAHGEIGGTGATRLATLLPLFRNFLLITIAVIAGMIALSEMGVDIAPLFAGAGVVGLAIGFGAQTLIRDIFSGAFFLIDDAFRKGEYVDIGSAKGTVERISIRSFQLRHHNGPLNTVPFGEIKHITNFSRDWVMMKLPLRVTYDTDVEKVRKLIKKLGQQLLEDPELGPMFMQPLKSQGVIQMDDSAMIIRVKFMTKPGDQFVTRREVYRHVREVFEKNDIKFAHREVTVRVADDDHPLTAEQKKQVAGSVVSAMQEEQAGQAGGKDDR